MACTVIHGGSPISTGYVWKAASRVPSMRILDERLRRFLHGNTDTIPTGTMTCGELFSLFIATRKERLSPLLQAEYARFMAAFVPSGKRVTDTAGLRTAIAARVTASHYSHNSRRQGLKRVRAVFQFGIEQGALTVNPVHRDMVPVERVDPATPYTDEEVELLLANLDERPRLFVAFLASTGCRAVEAVRLTWDAVGSDAVTIDGKRTRRDVPKYRVVPFALVPELHGVLHTARLAQWDTVTVFGYRNYHSIARAMKTVTQDARGFHDLRKYAINRWVRLGWPETVIQAIAGHDRAVSEKHYRTPFTASELVSMAGTATHDLTEHA